MSPAKPDDVDPDAGPVAYALARLGSRVSHAALPYLSEALSAGRSRLSVHEYAHRFGVASRTIQATHALLHLPPPKRLLAWGQALWAAHQIHVWRRPLKRVAADAGFRRPSDLTTSLKAFLDGSLREFSPEDILDRLEAALAEAPPV